MLNATRRLLRLYERPLGRFDRSVLRDGYTAVVVRHGGAADADALLPAFLSAPGERDELLPPLMAHGDDRTARAVFDACLDGGRVRPGVPEEVLHLLGYLGHPDAEAVLWPYAAEMGKYTDHRAAVLGLLSLPCDGLRAEIEKAVRGCAGRNLFPEFLPALASKTGRPGLLDEIVLMGETTASTDCNGGIILGIALYGEAGREAFGRVLWDPIWEAFGGGTGSDRWLYAGARALGLRVVDLFAELRAGAAPDRVRCGYHLKCLAALVEVHLGGWNPWVRPIVDPGDAPADLYEGLFEPSGADRDDSLTGLWRDLLGDFGADRPSELRQRLAAAVAHRIETDELLGPGRPH